MEGKRKRSTRKRKKRGGKYKSKFERDSCKIARQLLGLSSDSSLSDDGSDASASPTEIKEAVASDTMTVTEAGKREVKEIPVSTDDCIEEESDKVSSSVKKGASDEMHAKDSSAKSAMHSTDEFVTDLTLVAEVDAECDIKCDEAIGRRDGSDEKEADLFCVVDSVSLRHEMNGVELFLVQWDKRKHSADQSSWVEATQLMCCAQKVLQFEHSISPTRIRQFPFESDKTERKSPPKHFVHEFDW